MSEEETLIEFPCDFVIKVIGNFTPVFFEEIIQITRQHFPTTPDTAFKTKPSKENRFISISVTVYAENKPSLDALYMAYTRHPEIKMVL